MARLVKRYSNRKLYDTSESRYVTLDEIARWVKSGEEVKILENESGEDLTAVTFAQIILEEERKKSGLLSLRVMRELIQHPDSICVFFRLAQGFDKECQCRAAFRINLRQRACGCVGAPT